MPGDEWIRIETAIKKGEVDESILNFVKLKVGFKDTLLFGIIEVLEREKERMQDKKKREGIQKSIEQIKRSLGIM